MLSLDMLLSLAAYAFVMTITPGPNNVLLLASGLAFGVRRTGWHLAGVLAGTWLMICLVGAGLGALFVTVPAAQTVLKLAGSGYMLWLAHQLWNAGALSAVDAQRPIRFFDAAVFQIVNPKVWVMATTVIAAFVPAGDQYVQRVVIAGLLFIAVAVPCITLWAAGGSLIRTWIHNPVTLRRINRVMALLAAATVVLFWL
ncbi:LysE family translocator [Thermithiobacillus plumbiphilus]|jgi:threonine/homoserine/homoserine lactone efflux protein|uniref:LysE family translocator n=1 Tax=Thermithiobacillus plumbiphilus TaxID=1729899 RepID=A0ABU9D6U9_9PROT